jgi:hypothetical protein
MSYIEDMWPKTILDRNKWHDWLDMYGIEDRCKKNPWHYFDWKIHKRLLDAGGLGSSVYIMPARGQGKLYAQLELYAKLLAEGRTVIYRLPDKLHRPACVVGDILDYDILTPAALERADRIWREYWKERN